MNHKYNPKKRLAKDINKATYLWDYYFSDLIKIRKIEPIIGNKISDESMGKFII